MYGRVFEGHAEGALILEDLVARFYDRALHPGRCRGCAHDRLQGGPPRGRRFILAQIGQVKEGDPNVEA
jgi:hypothetical protein